MCNEAICVAMTGYENGCNSRFAGAVRLHAVMRHQVCGSLMHETATLIFLEENYGDNGAKIDVITLKLQVFCTFQNSRTTAGCEE